MYSTEWNNQSMNWNDVEARGAQQKTKAVRSIFMKEDADSMFLQNSVDEYSTPSLVAK
jgi:hypothetical protein